MPLHSTKNSFLIVLSIGLTQCLGASLEITEGIDTAIKRTSQFVETTTCPMYACKPENIPFPEDTCTVWDEANNTYWCNPCTDPSKVCTLTPQQNATCNTPITPDRTGQSYPGEICSSFSDCDASETVACTNGKCQGSTAGQVCTDPFSCHPGFTCNSMKCVPQTKAGSKGCLNDYDCENGSACNVTDFVNYNANKCIKYGTVRPHEIISDCNTFSSYLCQYYYCAEIPGGAFACTEQLKSPGKIPLACTTKQGPCTSTSDEYFDPPFSVTEDFSCECAYTTTGNDLYCNLFYGDDPYVTYLNKLLQWLRSPNVNKCNTGRRFDNWCIYSNWDKKNYDALLYYHTVVNFYPFIQKTEPCVLKSALDQGYWIYREAYNNDDSSAALLAFSILIIELL